MKIRTHSDNTFELTGTHTELEALAELIDIAIETYSEWGEDMSATQTRVANIVKLAEAHVAISTEPFELEET